MLSIYLKHFIIYLLRAPVVHRKIVSFIYLTIFICTGTLWGQNIYENISSPVYDFLKRQNDLHRISYNTALNHLSRVEIAKLLAKIPENSLSPSEKWQFNWLQDEYFTELKSEAHNRWYLLLYRDTLFTAKVTPLAGYSMGKVKDNSQKEQFIGAKVSVEISDWFGGQFEYLDRGEFGTYIDRKKEFSSAPGSFYKDAPNGIEFSEVTGAINANWKWGSLSLQKEKFTWGSGQFSQLIFSNKAPSFPRISLTITPNDRVSFTYFHGWLNSMVYDSNSFYYNHTESSSPFLRRSYVPKYIAANMLSVRPWDWFNFAIGNSFIYSGNLRPEMFIPFMYYKVMDHNTGREQIEDGNGQLFSDYRFLLPQGYTIYGTIFLDVLEIRELLASNFKTMWAAWTIGAQKYNALTDGLDVTVEYSRVNPWVYEHKDQTASYKHIDYQLGHWIGQNADHIGLKFAYTGIENLRSNLSIEMVRKGGAFDISIPYKDKENKINFLTGTIRKELHIKADVTYEYLHDLYTSLQYEYSYITDQDHTRYPAWLLGANNFVHLSLRYGLRY